ncbi:uncharacterized protein LOC123518188 [Portunus trituberculatus]|uniref:uncharacterized protein LOC123518188 n=1 Tax=Portunus trituberculatus TaxID=210409 RepID=UPI001E1CDC14|nr:uncharacterized protein LOC123518188 [Portunus trituberculatus]XP_045134812.1 uncharacterized protein LOC123518188 [Portunus trituberculatus]
MKATLVAVVVVGLTLMTGGGSCLSDYMVGDAMQKLTGFFRSEGDMVNRLMSYQEAVRHCTCFVHATEGHKENEKCQCIKDMKECDKKHKIDSSLTFEETRDILYRWVNCLGPKKLRVAYRCREEMIHNPYEMMCKDWTLNCE